jgi:hypothetical protein
MRVCGPSARRWRSTYWRELPRDGTNGEHWSRLQHGGQNAKVSHTGARRAIEAAKVNVAIPSHRSRRLVPPAQDRGSTSFERPPAAIVRWTTKEKTAEPPLSLCASEMKILPIVPAPRGACRRVGRSCSRRRPSIFEIRRTCRQDLIIVTAGLRIMRSGNKESACAGRPCVAPGIATPPK